MARLAEPDMSPGIPAPTPARRRALRRGFCGISKLGTPELGTPRPGTPQPGTHVLDNELSNIGLGNIGLDHAGLRNATAPANAGPAACGVRHTSQTFRHTLQLVMNLDGVVPRYRRRFAWATRVDPKSPHEARHDTS